MGGDVQFVGCGQGAYIADTNYRFVGYGGDYSTPRRRDFTCLICTALSLLLGLLAVMWCLWPADECEVDQLNWKYKWDPAKRARCCTLEGIGCEQATARPPVGPVDPFNCADGFTNWQADWSSDKKVWCCNVHKRGCGLPAPMAANWFDCDSGFANYVKGWSVNKKAWCCGKEKKGCLGSGDLNMIQTENMGYGAGAQHGFEGAPVAQIHTR